MNTLLKYAIAFTAAAFCLNFAVEAAERLQAITEILRQIGR